MNYQGGLKGILDLSFLCRPEMLLNLLDCAFFIRDSKNYEKISFSPYIRDLRFVEHDRAPMKAKAWTWSQDADSARKLYLTVVRCL